LALRHIFVWLPSVDSELSVAVTEPDPLAIQEMTRSAPAVSVAASSLSWLKVTTAFARGLGVGDGDGLALADAEGDAPLPSDALGAALPPAEALGETPTGGALPLGEALAWAWAVDDGAGVADGLPPLSSVVARTTPTSSAKMNARTMTSRCMFVMG
jgi:hypothetical protein